MALNKVMLIGNVGNDPEIRYLDSSNPQGNTKVASFRLATTERYRDRNGETRENTEWHNIVAWRNSADLVEKYVHKGSQIFIEGKLRTRQWTDQTGNKRFTTEVQADNIQLLGRRPDGQGNGPDYGGGYGAQRNSDGGYGQRGSESGYGQRGGYEGGQHFGPQPSQGGFPQPSQAAPAAPADATEDDLPF